MADYSVAKMNYDAIVRQEQEENELEYFRGLSPREQIRYLANQRKEKKLKDAKNKKFYKASAMHTACDIILTHSDDVIVAIKKLSGKSKEFLTIEKEKARAEMLKLF